MMTEVCQRSGNDRSRKRGSWLSAWKSCSVGSSLPRFWWGVWEAGPCVAATGQNSGQHGFRHQEERFWSYLRGASAGKLIAMWEGSLEKVKVVVERFTQEAALLLPSRNEVWEKTAKVFMSLLEGEEIIRESTKQTLPSSKFKWEKFKGEDGPYKQGRLPSELRIELVAGGILQRWPEKYFLSLMLL